MAKTLSFDMDDFRKGLILLNDDSNTPPGSARTMENILITDRGGIAPRPGVRMLGTRSPAVERGRGFAVFKKSYGDMEIPIRAHGTILEAYTPSADWFQLKDGFTNDKEFGFAHNFVTTENEDYLYYSNRYEPFQRWNGQLAYIQGALTGGETTITVDTTLRPDIFSAATATAAGGTQLTQADETWGTDQWVGMWVLMTSGALAGEISKITSNNANQINFGAFGGGSPSIGDTFEIREALFDIADNAEFTYNGTNITVTAIPTSTTLTVGSAHAAPDGTPIFNAPQEYPEAPRGNRMSVLKGRTWVGKVRSALSRGSGGALQGWNVGSTIFGTKLDDPTSFEFSAPRVASEGIIAQIPYGGTDITDVKANEDVIYVYKRNYIESFQMNEVDDGVNRQPLKVEAGSVNRVIVGRDDHYFITLDKQFTSLGRVATKDVTVQTQNIGLPIKRLLDELNFDQVNGVEYQNRILFSCRSGIASENNDITIVWNKTTRSFEGVWNIGAQQFDTYNDDLYYQEASGPNVWKLFEEAKTDFSDTDELPIASVWQSNFFNLAPIKGNYQAINSFAFEGYISAEAEFSFSLYKDFATLPSYTFTFGGLSDEEFLVGSTLASFLGSNPLGLQPIGVVEEPDADGRRRFTFMVYIPFLYGQYFSIGFDSFGLNQNWEIIRASLGVREMISTIRPNIRRSN